MVEDLAGEAEAGALQQLQIHCGGRVPVGKAISAALVAILARFDARRGVLVTRTTPRLGGLICHISRTKVSRKQAPKSKVAAAAEALLAHLGGFHSAH